MESLLRSLWGFWGECSEVAPKLLRSCLNVEISRRNTFRGNFLEVCFRTPGTSQKLLQKCALRCIRLFSVLAIPPSLRAMGFWCLNMANWVRYPLPPFLSRRACEVEVRYPPLKRGISAILARYPTKTRQMGAIPPSAILSRKGIARYGWVSRAGPPSPFQNASWDPGRVGVGSSGKKKAHKHKLFGPVALGTTLICPWDKHTLSKTNPGFLLFLHNGSPWPAVCPRDEPSLSLGQRLGLSGFSFRVRKELKGTN